MGSAVFNPIDVVRIRMQGPRPYPSTLGAFSAIIKREGVAGMDSYFRLEALLLKVSSLGVEVKGLGFRV